MTPLLAPELENLLEFPQRSERGGEDFTGCMNELTALFSDPSLLCTLPEVCSSGGSPNQQFDLCSFGALDTVAAGSCTTGRSGSRGVGLFPQQQQQLDL